LSARFDLLHRLMQAAAERDIDLLGAATDAEQRQAALQRLRYQRQRAPVARRIERQLRVMHVLAETARMHVRRRAGQQHAVGELQQRRHVVGGCVGHHQRQTAREAHRVDVLLPGDVERMSAEFAIAGGEEDQRLAIGIHAGSDATGQAAFLIAAASISATRSICARSMISGGDSAIVSPVVRISRPFS
jgi:hypothetical protein